FTGKSQASLITAIMSSDPVPISSIQPMTPPTLDRVVKTSLAKDPDDRWQTAHDVMLQLQWIAEAGSQAGASAPIVARRNRESLWWRAALGILLLGLFTALLFAISRPRHAPADARVMKLSVILPEKATGGAARAIPILSPDGRSLAFLAS